MTYYSSTITFGALTLIIDRIMVNKVPGTIKQVIGKKLIQKEVPDRVVQDWAITIEGKHVDSSRDTDRITLESYDDLTTHTLTDGQHDGDYFITSLRYEDDGNRPTSHKFTLSLIQDQ